MSRPNFDRDLIVEHDVRIAPLTTLRVGGAARSILEVTTDEQLVSAVEACDRAAEPLLLLGGGSNVVVGDSGFDGTVVRIMTRGVVPVFDGEDVVVTVAAGETWDRFAAAAVGDGWAGVEALSGIPGSVGATPIQNVGAYGRDVAQVIESVTAYDRIAGHVEHLAAQDCRFGYRNSRFKAQPDRWVILQVTFRLAASHLSAPIRYADLATKLSVAAGDQVSLDAVRRAVLTVRRAKGMVLNIDDHDTWSVGSFFTNPIVDADVAAGLPDDAPKWSAPDGRVKLSAAWLIEQSGFGKGWPNDPDAPARLSTKHTLALTNRGAARTSDIIALADTIRDAVASATGVTLVPEPNLVNCAL